MNEPAPSPPSQDARDELGELRSEVARLAAELEATRAQVATLAALALEDPLTGLLNRRGFFRELSRAIAYRTRYGTEAALMLADLDRFKPINDAHGHAVGDRALQHLAAVLRGSVRASDSVGRLGGDEFALILWKVDEAAARQKAVALEAAVASSPVATEAATLALGVSIGVAMLQPADTTDSALARADAAMYVRKAERRTSRR